MYLLNMHLSNAASKRLKSSAFTCNNVVLFLFFTIGFLRVADRYEISLIRDASAQKNIDILNISDTHVLKTGGRSDYWMPYIATECGGLDLRSAPCLLERQVGTNMVAAQEIIYKPFRLRFPGFLNETQRNLWMNAIRGDTELNERLFLREHEGYAVYPTQYGQNLLFQDAQYRGDPPPDVWKNNSCMEHSVSHSQFLDTVNMSSGSLLYDNSNSNFSRLVELAAFPRQGNCAFCSINSHTNS